MSIVSHLWLGVFGLGLVAMGPASASQDVPATARHKLENGVTVLLHAVPGVEQVAVEAFYGVGLVHEPEGMAQAAHVLEHLVCNAATASYKAGESMQGLNAIGLANAETMPDWTHYDYTAPAHKLEEILKIEAERLVSLAIDEATIRQEGPRAAQEVDFVEGNPRAGMGKFAFCALAQSWRHGRDVAHVRTGLEKYSAEALEEFRRATYRPENLTLVIVGDFEEAEALELARKHVGAVAKAGGAKIEAIDWSKVAKRATVKWDSKVQAVCIAFLPPQDPVERAVLSLWGAMIQQRFSSDAELLALADAIYTPNHMWPVGELPFFVYAAAKPGADLEKLETLLAQRVAALVESGGGVAPASLAMYSRQLSAVTQTLSEPAVRQTARVMAQQGRTEAQALSMVLGQGAINWGVADRFLGDEPAPLVAGIQSLTAERFAEILQQNLDKEAMRVTYLVSE